MPGACGCSQGHEQWIDGLGTRVRGEGTERKPRAVDLDLGTGTDAGCHHVMDCVGSNAGRGLTYNQPQANIAVKLSGNEDNLTGWDSDYALYTPGGELAVAVVDIAADTPMLAQVVATGQVRQVRVEYPADLPEPHSRVVRFTGPCQYEETVTATPGEAIVWTAPDCDGDYTVKDEVSDEQASFAVPVGEPEGTVLGEFRVGWWLTITNRPISQAGIDYTVETPEADDPEPASGTLPPGEQVRWRAGEDSSFTVTVTAEHAAGQSVEINSGDGTKTVRLLGQGALVSSCARRVDALPAWIVGGSSGAGSNTTPWGVTRAYERAVDRGLPAATVTVFELKDHTTVVAPTNGFDPTWVSDPPPGQLADYTFADIGASMWATLQIPVGFSQDDIDPWYGFGEENQHGANTFEQVLAVAGGRLVLFIDVAFLNAHGIEHVIDQVATRCLTDAVVMYGPDLDALAPARDAGISIGATVRANTIETNTPQACVDAGVEWVIATTGPPQDDARVPWPDTSGYVTAGLQVMSDGLTSRWDRQAAINYQHRGFFAHDPPYVANDPAWLPADTHDEWISWSNMAGQFAWRAQTLGHFRSEGADNRGSRVQREGLYGYRMPRDEAYPRSSVLLGWAAPLADPERYNMVWNTCFLSDPGATSQYLAMVIGVLDDRPALLRSNAGSNDYPSYLCGYALKIHADGRMQLDRIDQGEFTQLGAYEAPAPEVDVWNRWRVEVTADEITFYDRQTTDRRINVVDGTYRGHYAHLLKYQTSGFYEAGFSFNTRAFPTE